MHGPLGLSGSWREVTEQRHSDETRRHLSARRNKSTSLSPSQLPELAAFYRSRAAAASSASRGCCAVVRPATTVSYSLSCIG